MTVLFDRLLKFGFGALSDRILKHLFWFFSQHPQIGDRAGFHVRPIHFYEPLPDFRNIQPEAGSNRHPSGAVDWNTNGQMRWAGKLDGTAMKSLRCLRSRRLGTALILPTACLAPSMPPCTTPRCER